MSSLEFSTTFSPQPGGGDHPDGWGERAGGERMWEGRGPTRNIYAPLIHKWRSSGLRFPLSEYGAQTLHIYMFTVTYLKIYSIVQHEGKGLR